jgi:hypothetical protein
MEGEPEEILLPPPPPKKGEPEEEMLLPPPPPKKKSSGQTYGADSETLPDAVPFVSASPYKPGGTEEILTKKKPQPIKTFTGELPKIDTTTGVDAAELEGEKQKKQAIQDLNIPEPAKIISPYGEELDPIEAFNKGISDNDKAIRTYSNQLKVESGALAPEEFINELETNYRLYQKTELPADPTGLSWLTNLVGGQAVNIGGAIGLSIINPLLSIAYGGTAAGAGAAGSTLQNNYMEYRAQGLTPEEAYANAVETAKSSFGFGAVEGSAGALVPGGGAATGIRAAAKDIAKDATFDALLATASQGAQNEIEQNKGLVRELTDGMLENATGEIVFSVLMGAFTKAPAALRNRNKVKYEIAQNSDEKIDQELKTRIENGDITPEQADEAFVEIKQYKETLAKVPDNLSDEAKQRAIELLQKREEIEKSIEGKDEALVQAQKEEIKAINDQLINLSNGKNQAEGREEGRQELPPKVEKAETIEDQKAKTELSNLEQSLSTPTQTSDNVGGDVDLKQNGKKIISKAIGDGDTNNSDFSNTKVVDESGKPKQVFHGTWADAPFEDFKEGDTYFTDNYDTAKMFGSNREGGVDTENMDMQGKPFVMEVTDTKGNKTRMVIANTDMASIFSDLQYDVSPVGEWGKEDLNAFDASSIEHHFGIPENKIKSFKIEERKVGKNVDDFGVSKHYINLENPLIIDAKGDIWNGSKGGDIQGKINDARKSGKYDGVIVKNIVEGGLGSPDTKPTTTYVVFNKPKAVEQSLSKQEGKPRQQLTTPAETINTTESQETENKEDITNISEQTINTRENEDFKKEEKTEVSEPKIAEQPEDAETNTDNKGNADTGGKGELSVSERDNLAKIEAETGDNFRVIQNVYNKYGGAKPISEINTEDYLKAKEKRESDPERFRRKFIKQVLKDEYIPNNVKQAFTEDTIYYDRLPNSITAKTAKQLLSYLGTANAQKEVMDLGNGMPSAVRFVMAQEILAELRTDGDYDTFNDFLEKFVPLTTDFGQGIQALSLYGQSNPETNIRKAQKMVQKQREKRIKKSKAAKVVKEIKKINTEAANEAINKTKGKIKKAAGIKPEINSSTPSYGRKNKIVTKERYEQLKKQLKGKLFSSPIPPELIEIGVFHIEAGAREFKGFAKVMIKDFGKKIRPYLKSIYNKSTDKFDDKEGFDDDYTVDERLEKLGQDEADKIIRSLLKSGKKSDAKKATEEINLIPNKKSVWGRYKTASIDRLKKLLLSEIQSDINSSPILKAFTDGLTKNISQQILEAQGAENKPKKPSRTPIEIISDAYRNFEKYQEVWEETQRQIQEQFKNNPEKLNELDSYFGDILNNPFSEKLVSQSVKSGMKDLDIKIEEIVRQHYTVYDYTKTKLVDKLIREAELSDTEAKELSNAIEKEFDKIATEKKQQILGRIFTDKQRKKPEIRTLEQKIIELTNLGAFEDEEIIKKYADAFGFPKLTPENIEKITELSNRIQEAADGFEKFRAIEDLLSYQASLKGVSWWEIPMSLWYSSMLSGPNTQLRNFVANASSALLLYTNAITQNPKASTMIAKGFINGVSKGLFEASETLKTGYSPIRGKVEVPTVLERTDFKGLLYPLNSAKYVRRVMVAADVLFFEGLREMRAYHIAYKKAIEKGNLEPDKDLINSAYEILNKSDGSLELAQEQAESEYQRKIQDIESSDANNKQFLRKQAVRDKKRRVYELIEQGRAEDFSKETSTFASKGTYNYPPDGVLGAMARSFNQFSEKVPLAKLIVPFTNIIANVFNETLNYTPIGLLASQTKGGLFVKPKTELTPQEKVDQMVKGVIGTALLTTLLLMTQDDEEFEITANGTGDYRKNYELRELGWQPYSIKYKNKWYSYQYSPLMLAFSMIGNVRDVEKYRKEKLTDNGLWTKFGVAMGATSRAALDQTFLSSANSFLSAALDPRNENAMEDLLRSMQKTATAAVIPAIYSQTAKEMEEIFNIPTKEVRGTWMGSILKDIPVARDQYFNKVNALGEDIVPTNNIFINSTKQDKIWDLIVKNKAWIGVPPPSSTTLVEIKDGKPIERVMTDSEYYNFAKERGTIIKAQIQARYKELEKLEPEQVRKQISDIKADATKSAKLVVLGLIKKFEEVWKWDKKNEVWIEKN